LFQRAQPGAETKRSDLLALDVDVNVLLPPDTISQGFDNVADAGVFAGADGRLLRAASRVTALAVGDAAAEATEARTASRRPPRSCSVEGALFGTRGGMLSHTFPPTATMCSA
jgi:hypothetical protein